MKFSLLIPTKNRPEMLRTAIRHILKQSYENFEAVIVDDGHTRNEEMIALSAKDARVRYIWRNASGIGSAMNDAMRAASGDIFNWHNDDDFIAKRTLEFVAKNIGDAKWCYGRIVTMNKYRIPVGLMGRPFNFDVEKHQSTIPQPAVFWTRKAFETVGFFDETIDHATDHEYWLRLAVNFEPKFFNHFFAYYMVHENMGSKRFAELQTKQWLEIGAKYKDVKPHYLNQGK